MIVVFGTRKGGAGKSTLSLNIAALRKLKGHDVCMVDCDDQKTVTRWNATRNAHGVEPAIPLINALGTDVVSIIREQAKRYDDLVIDVPGRDAAELRHSLLVCDVMVIPVKVSLTDVWALEKDVAMVYELQQQRKAIGLGMRVIMLFNEVPTLPNVRDKQINDLAEVILQMHEQMQAAGIEVCSVQITDRDSFKKVLGKGKSIFEIPPENLTKSDQSAQEELLGLYDFIYGEGK